VIVSLWEAPPSTWGGPGINWASVPFDLFISNLDIICCNNINNSLKIYNSTDDDDSHKMVNNSYLITFNYMYLILNAIFSIYILRE
jgi:hypothetical protein